MHPSTLYGPITCNPSYTIIGLTKLQLPRLTQFLSPPPTFRATTVPNTSGSHKDKTAMPEKCSSSTTSFNEVPDSGKFGKFKQSEDSFLASLMPKKEIAADKFIQDHPLYDGRGVVIAIFDSGVDPSVTGLQVTSDGKPKVLDVLDCTGSGDVDTSTVVKADKDGCIFGASGASLVVNSSWKNPSGEWHVGCKLVYELFTNDLTTRLKKERRKKWDERNQEAIAEAVTNLHEFDQKHKKIEDQHLKRLREDLQNRVDILQKQADSYDDKGPVIDAVVWHDGEVWRVALDTQSLEDESEQGKLVDFVPLTNYRIERKFGVFSKLDACSFVTNVYEEGNILSIVTDCSPHGTHVAGIATAFHPHEPLLNGVAPGAQVISCKIGDARLGSMETGTGLTRAIIAAVDHKCDLINMSYGEPSLLPDYGRFVDLINEAVDKHHLIFVSSAGNEGPALSTVGAPGGTTSSIIGIGAYVSPAMAAGAHCVVEPPNEGLEYTWSSRGPTADGDIGVSVSAPGGAVAPVPTWTLQRRMLMNGTSMSSPSACGGIALIISAMKAEGVHVSPYSVRRALENTCVPISSLPEERLTTGMGLMKVDKAYDYVKKSLDSPSVWYEVKINLSGKTKPTFRGIYLRESSSCQQPAEWTVEVAPKFHEDASNLDDLVPFEECIELHSSDTTVVKAPEYLLLTHNGRGFNVIVDPTNLEDGLHYYEVYGIDSKAPWRGPLFRIPVTITKAMAVRNCPPVVSFTGMQYHPGHIERRYIEVPVGATWVEATMRASGFDTSRRFFVDAVQLSPLKRYLKMEKVVIFSSPSAKTFSFAVEGGRTIELAVAQFWSSGIGSQETTIVDFEIEFHGVSISNEELILGGSEVPVRIDVSSLISSENVVPSASLNKVRIPFRPVDTQLRTLPTNRDRLPSGKQTLAMTLTYKFKLEDGAEIKPYIPLFNNRVYDTKFESQFYMISDVNKRVYTTGDVYPKAARLPKGEFTLQLYLRHDDMQLLEKLKTLVIFIERTLEDKEVIRLSFYSQPDGHMTGSGSFKSSVLIPGSKEAFYVGPPTKDKLPKNCPEGSLLVGAISYGKLSYSGDKGGGNPKKNPVSYVISYVVPPCKPDEDKGKSSTSSTKSVAERLVEEVRDAKINILTSLKQNSEELHSEWEKLSKSLKSEYPKYTPLLAKILEGVLSQDNVKDKCHHLEEVIDAADEVIDSINRDELAIYLSQKSVPEDDEEEKTKKQMEMTRDLLAEALYNKGLALSEIESLKAEGKAADTGSSEEATLSDKKQDKFEATYKELRKWVDVKSSKYGLLSVIRERRSGRLGTSLKVLNDIIDDKEAPKKKLYELKISLIEEIGWKHVASYERQWMHIEFHGVSISNEELILGGSEVPVRIDVSSLISSENVVPSASLNKVRIPFRPVDTQLRTLPTNRDRLPSGKQTLAMTLTYKFKLEDGAEIKPYIPLFNNRVYDTKFESQFYMISDVNKRVYTTGDVYPKAARLPKGEFTLQLYLRHDDMQLLEKLKTLVIFIERTLEDKEVIRLSFYSQPDGHMTGSGSFKSSVLIPGSKEAFYVGPPTKDKLPKNCPEGSLLVGAISYGKLSYSGDKGGGNPKKNPVSYVISYVVPPCKPDEDKGKSSTSSTKSVAERLVEEVRDAKINILTSLKQNSEELHSEWEKLSKSLKSEYPKYTPLLAKILEGVLSQDNVKDKCHHLEEVIDAADEVIDSINRDELAIYLSQKSVPEDDEEEKTKKQMEMTRDLLAEALYNKGLALSEIESLKAEGKAADTGSSEEATLSDKKQDKFEATYKELRKWVDVKSSKYGLLSVIRERRSGRLGTSLKVLNDIIDDKEAPKKKLYELKISLIEEIGWKHVASYERQWMHVRFPSSLPPF